VEKKLSSTTTRRPGWRPGACPHRAGAPRGRGDGGGERGAYARDHGQARERPELDHHRHGGARARQFRSARLHAADGPERGAAQSGGAPETARRRRGAGERAQDLRHLALPEAYVSTKCINQLDQVSPCGDKPGQCMRLRMCPGSLRPANHVEKRRDANLEMRDVP